MADINQICLVNMNQMYFVLCKLTLSHVRHKSNMPSQHKSNVLCTGPPLYFVS